MTRHAYRGRHHRSGARAAKRAGLVLLLVAAFTLVGTSAWAYWTTAGYGTGSATTGTLNPPTNPIASNTNGSSIIGVSWTASAGPTTPTGYYVTRKSGTTTVVVCGSATLITGTSCTDSAASYGTYTYTVTAVLQSWTASSDPTGQVAILVPQVVTWSPTTNALTTASPLTPSPLASALGGAPISYSVISKTTSTCTVAASTGVLTYTGAGTCTVRATAAATSVYAAGTLEVTFTVSVAPQVVTWSPTTNVLTTASPLTPSPLASALGGVPISYSVISMTTTTCTVAASTGVLTYTGTGTCMVRATAAATTTYAVGTSDVTFTVFAAPTDLTISVQPGIGITANWTEINGFTYECQITNRNNGANSRNWKPCTSGTQYLNQNGSHTFYVRVAGAPPGKSASLGFSGW